LALCPLFFSIAGLQGVDNGQIWFDKVRVTRDALLDRYASVDAQGRYSSPVASVSQRFGTMVGGLTTGRMLIAQGAVDACKIGVTVAIKYALKRPQFGDKPIMAYITHQRRLLPALATTYAMHLSMLALKQTALGQGGEAAKRVHVDSSGLKAAATWHRVRILQDARECCGGMGFLAANRIGPMLNDMNVRYSDTASRSFFPSPHRLSLSSQYLSTYLNPTSYTSPFTSRMQVDTTFEGDNTVLMQQAARPLVEAAARARGAAPALPRINPDHLGPGCCGLLLRWRRDALAAGVAAEAAAGGAADASVDEVVEVGWAYVDSLSYDTFLAEAKAAPEGLRGVLGTLSLLYGLSRVEEGAAAYLAGGALPGSALALLRKKIHALCGTLIADGGRAALALCDGFGVPQHLLQAPIAQDWRGIDGTQVQ
jgi:acyl-CoA oxidase